MDDLIVRILVLSAACLIGTGFNLYVYRHPEFVDSPLEGWLGKFVKPEHENKADRLKIYQRYARRNFIVMGILFLLLIKDLITLFQRLTT